MSLLTGALCGASAWAATRPPPAVVVVSVAARVPDAQHGACTLWRVHDVAAWRTRFIARCGAETHA
ncbi:MAG: hypothetical protein NW200_07215 [Hyphomonadaceae bacterium]|nr:hypothetical protein [Hyphomonadaceae bacterium]